MVPLGCAYNARITVKDNEIVDVLSRQDGWDDSSPMVFLPPEKWEDYPCNYRQFTITKIFEDLEETLLNIDPSNRILELSFDPNFGYVISMESAVPVGHGIFSPKISECCYKFTFSDFQRLNSSTP